MQEAGVTLLEPIMLMEVVVPEEYSSAVTRDLSKRRADIQHVDVRGQNKVTNSILLPRNRSQHWNNLIRQ